MEKFYHSDFEELIKEKADQYKMYPSDKVWKGIDRSLRLRRRWYWTGFVLLLSGVSYLAINELMSPDAASPVIKIETPAPKPRVTAEQLNPFSSDLSEAVVTNSISEIPTITSDFTVEEKGNITAAFEIPLHYLPGNTSPSSDQKASFLISDLEPLAGHEQYNIELSWPVADEGPQINSPSKEQKAAQKIILHPKQKSETEVKTKINWLQDFAPYRIPLRKTNRISWQLAFSPTVNYRKLTGSRNAKFLSSTSNIPVALRIEGDIDNLVNHKPALGFELGTHGLLKLNNRITLKGGIQFNYSKYDIRAFRVPGEFTTITLNSQSGVNSGTLVSYSNLSNFGGTSVQDLKNQYYQLSLPVGFELRLFGSEKLQFNVASTIQPTYLINRNTYLITTDYKNYTKQPSLVRRWNVNAGAEAFIAYTRGDVKWQVGPQFRYQLLSSYQNIYPIKEYLMEYGIKVGITKTIR